MAEPFPDPLRRRLELPGKLLGGSAWSDRLHHLALVDSVVVADQVQVKLGRVCLWISRSDRMNSAARWRSMRWLITLFAFTSRAANSVVVPWRLVLGHGRATDALHRKLWPSVLGPDRSIKPGKNSCPTASIMIGWRALTTCVLIHAASGSTSIRRA
ncbi:hypothetical protein [Falsiroseomonas tokyonensis]|uniref:hypothetical protein n=1 Tax=Falsiroseomonas tokyonensis TaxID=430521 RepID=UPI001C2022C6|nr:hypothetical protein [Falsiroseomonas tokyonensis]